MVVHIVEDDEAVADALSLALGDLDHQPRTYPDGETFLTLAELSARDWVIVDLGLPGMSGTDIVHRLKELPVELNILAISGNSRNGLLRQTRELPDLKLLRKPLSIEMLTAAMV